MNTTTTEPAADTLIEETTNKPVSSAKHFNFDFALFKNEGQTGKPFFSLQLTKSFKKGEGDYEDRSISLLLKDWPTVRAYMDELHKEGLERTFAANTK